MTFLNIFSCVKLDTEPVLDTPSVTANIYWELTKCSKELIYTILKNLYVLTHCFPNNPVKQEPLSYVTGEESRY